MFVLPKAIAAAFHSFAGLPHRSQRVGERDGVVFVNDSYEVVPEPVARKIMERDEAAVVVLHERQQQAEQDEDDPYAGYEIPDDLMW